MDIASNVPNDQPVTSRLSFSWFSLPKIRNRKTGIKRIGYASFGVGLLLVWLIVTVSFANDEVKYQRKNYSPIRRTTTNSQNDAVDQLWILEGSLVEFDTDKRSLSITWTPKIVQDGQTLEFGTSDNTTWEIGVFRDEKIVPETDPTAINAGSFYRVDNSTAVPIAVVGNDPWDSFDTDIGFEQAKRDSAWRQPLFGFPFDHWAGSIVFVANLHDLAEQNRLNVSFALEWDDVYLVDSIINWRIKFNAVNTCTRQENGSLVWIAGTGPCEMEIDFLATRTGLVVFACVVAVVVNWLSTIFIFIMTCEGVIMRRFQVIEGPQLLAVCFTALFALPSVRSILPGAPEFGCLIDLIGIVPNIIFISLCTTAVAIATLRNLIDKNNDTARITDRAESNESNDGNDGNDVKVISV